MKDIYWLKAYMEYKVELLSKYDAEIAAELFDWGRDRTYLESIPRDIKNYRKELTAYILYHPQQKILSDTISCPYCYWSTFHVVLHGRTECDDCYFSKIKGSCTSEIDNWYDRMRDAIFCNQGLPLSNSIGYELHTWVKRQLRG